MQLHRRNRAAGFTLIELLVVVAIIAVLVALSAGVFFRVRAGQQEKLAGDKVIQIQKIVQQQVSAALDNARTQPIPDVVKAYAQNDPDRAKSIWAYLHLRKNFPENVTEARSPVVLPGTALGIPPQIIFQPDAAFLTIPSTATTLNADQQAAICLYVSLMKVERRGMGTGLTDAMTQQIAGQMVFADTFNVPLSFRRLFNPAEAQNKPYVANPLQASKDPLDPLGKLALLPANYKLDLMTAIHTPAAGVPQRQFDGTNFLPTVFSYGLNKKPEIDNANQPFGDDLFGYRLNVEGRTGN